RVTELRPAREVGGPVAGIHVADRNQVARAKEGQQPTRPVPAKGNSNGRIHVGQAALRAGGGVSASASRRVGHRYTLSRGLRAKRGRSGIHRNKMADIGSYCNSFATASGHHENNTGARWKALKKCFMLENMIKIPVETPTATLRYALTPDEAGIAAIEATFAASDRMMAILAEVAPVGASLVTLHAQAYEKIRVETGLPARLVTLGLRDRAG